ncbi:glycosyltransferase family 2 protein [Roseobacter sp. YSTF-M11]|uniref:Glycosyltransferase family 2 protein n=1 Tax=Roseobacter insulae TaxID=2859783 RepID=A0A9X1FUN3_9RHOB|nr:glycosyltransferase family 2 protein [Roseobacter insulae]MBW4707977.1 glycosyltransferase family 2 protein [Roseobacter insulae]
MKTTAILTVKNEGAFLLEWLAHHRAVGVTDFVVCSNACSDGTDTMLDRLQEMGWLSHVRNDGPYGNRGIQFTALKRVESHPNVRAADWLLPLDVDEFVNVHVGNNTLADLVDALPEATAITLTWRLFGNAGETRFKDEPVTAVFRRCAPGVIHWPWRAAMFKTLYRNDGTYGKLGVHRPRAPDAARLSQARWFDGEGRELDDTFRKRRVFSDYGRPNHRLVQLNHYPLGAMESYLLKADRGRAVHSDDLLGLDYWVERNFNSDEDRSIEAVFARRAPLIAELMADARIAALHRSAVAWRRERFDILMRSDPFRALFGRLLMTPGSRPLAGNAARFLLDYARENPENRDN